LGALPIDLGMGILCGLLAALCWGLGDYLITQLTRRVGTTRAMTYIQPLSLLIWITLLALQFRAPEGGVAIWAIAIGTGVCHVAGLALVYRAFEVGTLSLVSPISSSFAVVTALLALATGERPPALALAGAGLLFIGIVFATRSPGESTPGGAKLTGIPEALGSAVGFGAMFWLFYFFVQPELGYIWPLIVLKMLASSSSLIARTRTDEPPADRPKSSLSKIWLLAIGAAVADTAAWLAYIWGTSTVYATVVTALASLFSVVTILLAWVLLKERLAVNQWVGVAVVLTGVFLVSI